MICPICNGKKYIEYEAGLIILECSDCKGRGEIDDSISGTEPDNQPAGSGNTGKSKQPRKSKAAKKARAKAG